MSRVFLLWGIELSLLVLCARGATLAHLVAQRTLKGYEWKSLFDIWMVFCDGAVVLRSTKNG